MTDYAPARPHIDRLIESLDRARKYAGGLNLPESLPRPTYNAQIDAIAAEISAAAAALAEARSAPQAGRPELRSVP